MRTWVRKAGWKKMGRQQEERRKICKKTGARSREIDVYAAGRSEQAQRNVAAGQGLGQQLERLQDRKEQCQKYDGKYGLETWSGSRMRLKRRMPNVKSWDEKIQKTSLAEAELDEESRNLEAGEERRASCASQPNRCCFDPTVVEQLITMGATHPWQQMQILQGELSKRLEVQHRPAPATPVHIPEGGEGGDEDEEEQRKRAASRQTGPASARA